MLQFPWKHELWALTSYEILNFIEIMKEKYSELIHWRDTKFHWTNIVAGLKLWLTLMIFNIEISDISNSRDCFSLKKISFSLQFRLFSSRFFFSKFLVAGFYWICLSLSIFWKLNEISCWHINIKTLCQWKIPLNLKKIFEENSLNFFDQQFLRRIQKRASLGLRELEMEN